MTVTFRSREVSAMVGATYRELDFMCREGLVEVDQRAGNAGSGNRRVWLSDDVLVARVVNCLASVSCSGAALRETAAAMRIYIHAQQSARKRYVVVRPLGKKLKGRDAYEGGARVEFVNEIDLTEPAWVVPL